MSGKSSAHRYVFGPARDRLTCACGHAEPIDEMSSSKPWNQMTPLEREDFNKALERMNAHIRATYTDEEWEESMQRTKHGVLDTMTGMLTLPAEGPKS